MMFTGLYNEHRSTRGGITWLLDGYIWQIIVLNYTL